MAHGLNYAELTGVEVQSIDETKRTAKFVAATRGPVQTWGGNRYFNMAGGDFSRFEANPVVLDSHNKSEIASIIGSAKVGIQRGKLMAAITFAETPRAETAWQLVQQGFARAVSIGFQELEITDIPTGTTQGVGKNKIEGPAYIAEKWELAEISLVPVPGDPAALLAAGIYHGQDQNQETAAIERIAHRVAEIIQIPVHTGEQETPMAQQDEQKTQAAEAVGSPAPVVQLSPVERESRDAQARAEHIRALAPQQFQALADELILQGATVEQAREKFLEALKSQNPPAGTMEPEQPTTDPATAAEQALNTMSADVFVSAICG